MGKIQSSLIFITAAALFFLVVGYTFQDVDLSTLIKNASSSELATVFGLGLVFHISFGLIMWVGFRLHYQLKLKLEEILFLPLMMHLFLYLLPIKGGMVFQVFYSKQKYKLDLSKGFSFGIMVFLISVVLTTVLGLFLTYFIPINSEELRIALFIMSICLLGFSFSINLLPSVENQGTGLGIRLINFFIRTRIQLWGQIKNWRLNIGLLITSFISVFVQAIWFWKTAELLSIHCEFAPVFLVVLVLRVVLLFRLLPGNLGVQEIMVGTVFAAADFSLEEGFQIAIATRLISVFWTGVIGLPALYLNLKFLEVGSLWKLMKKVAESNQ